MSDEHHPTTSDPVAGHAGTSYEGKDAKPTVIIVSLAIVAGLVVMGFAVVLGVQKYFQIHHPIGASQSALAPDRVIPPAPQVQVHPWFDLPEMRTAENKALNTTGRDQAGRMHIPIDSAMTEVLTRLKIAPNAARGLTTPGGQGIEYSHNLNELHGNERPEIQGEIRKNVQ